MSGQKSDIGFFFLHISSYKTEQRSCYKLTLTVATTLGRTGERKRNRSENVVAGITAGEERVRE